MSVDDFKGTRTPQSIAAGNQVNSTVVEYAEFGRIYEGCVDLIETMTQIRMPSGILIQSEPGMGKTLLLDLIGREMSKRSTDQAKGRCLHIELDSTVDVSKIATLMMHALGYPMLPSRPNLLNMNAMIATGFERVKPRAIMVDEFQHVCEGNRDITARAVTDWLKVRMDKFNVPLIGVGTRTMDRLATINDQFTSRVSSNYVLKPFAYGDSWRQLLLAFAAQVTLVNLEILQGGIAKPLHAITKGNLRALKKVLIYSCMYGALRPNACVTPEDVLNAVVDVFGQSAGHEGLIRQFMERKP